MGNTRLNFVLNFLDHPGIWITGSGIAGSGLPGYGLAGFGLLGSRLADSGLPGSGLAGSGLPKDRCIKVTSFTLHFDKTACFVLIQRLPQNVGKTTLMPLNDVGLLLS
jgi:hypothetical protein